MRYLIIDTEKIGDRPIRFWVDPVTKEVKNDDGLILSEEDTLLMFKDIWFRAQANSDENTAVMYDGLSEDERETMSWDEFKETL